MVIVISTLNVLQKSNLCTAIFLWRRLARSLAALRFVSPWHPCCFVLNVLCTRLLSIFSHLLFSPAVFIFPFLFAPLCSADPSFWGALFPTAAGVGPRQQRTAAVSEFVRSSCQAMKGLSRTQGHPCPFSPLSRLVARPLAFCFLPHSLTPLASFSSFLLAFASHVPFRIPAISPFPFKPSFFFSRCSN